MTASVQLIRRIHRNDPCACNSGNKYKNCCISKHGKKAKTKVTISK